MFPPPKAPNIEFSSGIREVAIRFGLKEPTEELLKFIALALTFRHQTGERYGISAWQHNCIDYIGARYLELLVAHCFLSINPDCSAAQLQEAMKKKTALVQEAENDLQLLKAANCPAEILTGHSTASNKSIKFCHSRMIGTLALLLPYQELKSLFEKFYFQRKVPGVAGLSFKTILQEYTQSKGNGLPTYEIFRQSGPSHATLFEIEVKVTGFPNAFGTELSKRKAQEAAAEQWLKAHAPGYLRAKTAENSESLETPFTRRPSSSAFDSQTQAILRKFNIKDKFSSSVRRALTCPSFGFQKHLAEFENNRTLALFGNLLFSTCFSHYIVSNYFSDENFHLKETSLQLIAGKAISTESLSPLAEQMGILPYLKFGTQQSTNSLNANQRAASLEAIIGAIFLSREPSFDLERAFPKNIIDHFGLVATSAKSIEDLKSPFQRLMEFAGAQQIRGSYDQTAQSGQLHKAIHVAKIIFASDTTNKTLIINGGKGANGIAARQSLARMLLPLFGAIHSDFTLARQLSSPELVDKISEFLLPAAVFTAPQSLKDARKWENYGLLGVDLLCEGNFSKYSLWVKEAELYLNLSGISLETQGSRVLSYYRLLRGAGVWDVRIAAKGVVTAIKEFVSANDSLERVRNIRGAPFFTDMQQLLRVLGLAAKENRRQITLRSAFEDLSILERGHDHFTYAFDGPELLIEEPEGAALELFREVISALKLQHAGGRLSIRTTNQNQVPTVEIWGELGQDAPLLLNDTINDSLLLKYLKAEGFVESIVAKENRIICIFPSHHYNSFLSKAKATVESPFVGLETETRSALSKLLHDLKNHLISAEIAIEHSAINSSRTMALRARAEASEHLDAASCLADQFASLTGVLGQSPITEISVTDFFKKLCARLFNSLPSSISLVVPAISEGARVWTSEQFIESIVENIVRNSIDAMTEGGRLELAYTLDDECTSWVITIKDTGPGIEQQLLKRLVSGQSVSSSKSGGSGIGMLTVVSMLRLIGGTITGKSSHKEGTEWTLSIPSFKPTETAPEFGINEAQNLSTE